jgi:hypothetical protein
MGLAILGAQPLAAQTTFGFKAGVSVSDLSIDTDEVAPDLESKIGILLGASVDVPLASGLWFQPGLSYVPKGAEITGEINGEEFTFTLGLDYVELPLLLKYAFPTTGSLGVHVFAGPALAFEVGCELGIGSEGVDVSIDCDQGEDEGFEVTTKSFDLGALVGGGVSVPMGGASLLFEASYNFGLTNIADTDEGEDDSVKNRAFYISAGIAFPMG